MQVTESPQAQYQQTLSDQTLPGRAILASRALFYTVLAMATAALAWAAVTKLDVVVEARGRLTVVGEPIRISVAEPGRVDQVAAHVGDHVHAGQLLLRLDSFHSASEVRRLQAERDAADAEAGRLRSVAAAAHSARTLIDRQMQLATETEKLTAGQLTVIRSLDKDFSAGELQHKEIELQDARNSSAKAQLALDQNAQDEASASAQAAAAELHAQALAAQISAASEAQRRSSIVAPTDGIITQMATSQPGVVVGLSEAAVVMIPDGRPLNAEVRIPNGSMRRLAGGLPARIRFDAFPHEDFGYLAGKLDSINPDAEADGTYRAWVKLDRMEMPGPLGGEKLRPGMELDARIVVDRESVLHLILRPVRRLAERGAVNQ
ncbi:MAG TPA: HlyD family efflux transporter periplasmic adaptor subunit [Tepidisphaeraceae bacterium]|jgi:multidrug resistance efflux pump|nr:HlyD family efflux transporter periplasmic adaptor subunit [Tepidisphaeraceae bacterium]